MAEEPLPLENLIMVQSVDRPDYISCRLIAKSDWHEVTRLMAEPGHFTTLFSLSGARALEGYKIPRAYNLIRVSERSPYLWQLNLETQLRTKWLGKAPETIEGELEQLIQLLHKVKEDSIKAKFPIRESGTSS